MTTKQALTELKKLSRQSAENLYRRIELAATVLQDLDWIAQVHEGSDLKAQDALQAEFFADLGGYVTLGKLIAMWRGVPKAQWQECRYNVAAVEVLYEDQAEPEQREQGKRTSWKAIAEERLGRIEELEAENRRLTTAVAQLREENGRLKGRIEQLERMCSREPVAA